MSQYAEKNTRVHSPAAVQVVILIVDKPVASVYSALQGRVDGPYAQGRRLGHIEDLLSTNLSFAHDPELQLAKAYEHIVHIAGDMPPSFRDASSEGSERCTNHPTSTDRHRTM